MAGKSNWPPVTGWMPLASRMASSLIRPPKRQPVEEALCNSQSEENTLVVGRKCLRMRWAQRPGREQVLLRPVFTIFTFLTWFEKETQVLGLPNGQTGQQQPQPQLKRSNLLWRAMSNIIGNKCKIPWPIKTTIGTSGSYKSSVQFNPSLIK